MLRDMETTTKAGNCDSRAGKRYREGRFVIEQTGDDRWYVEGVDDRSFERLKEARQFCRQGVAK